MKESHPNLYPYLSYILQDRWEIGSEPQTIIHIIEKHFKNYADLKILDLGCGKGAVSIREDIKNLSGYDAIILGSIGPVFGDFFLNCDHSVKVCQQGWDFHYRRGMHERQQPIYASGNSEERKSPSTN